MKPNHYHTLIISGILAALILTLTGCCPQSPPPRASTLSAVRPSQPAKPETLKLKKEIQITTAAVQSARRTTAAHKAQADEHLKTIEDLRRALIATALPLQNRLKVAQHFADRLALQMQEMSETNRMLEEDLIAAQKAAEQSALVATQLETEIAARDAFIIASEKWKDAAEKLAASQESDIKKLEQLAAKYEQFHAARWGRWIKISVAALLLTSAGWVLLIIYLRSNPTALAARIAGSALSNY